VIKHLQRTGKLPRQINTGGAHIQMRVLLESRGTDIRLTPDGKLVYQPILGEKPLPGGGVILAGERRQAKEESQRLCFNQAGLGPGQRSVLNPDFERIDIIPQ
jgi:hypothetical protein